MESRDGYNAASFPPLPYSRYLPNTVAAPSPLTVAHSQVSYPRTSFPSPFRSTRFPFFVLLAAETVYSECAAEDFPGRGNMRTPHGPYMSEAEPEPGLPARARARPTAPAPARPPPARRLPAACPPPACRLPALPSRAAVPRAPDGTGMVRVACHVPVGSRCAGASIIAYSHCVWQQCRTRTRRKPRAFRQERSRMMSGLISM